MRGGYRSPWRPRLGGKATKATGELAQLAPGELAMVFRPAGPRQVVARVFFEGNQVVVQ